MFLTAVIADLPANDTELETGIFASAQTPLLSEMNRKPAPLKAWTNSTMPCRCTPMCASSRRGRVGDARPDRRLVKGVAQDRYPYNYEMRWSGWTGCSSMNRCIPVPVPAWMVAAIGLLVLFIATANFINLSLAGSARREKEVGVRKVSGAARRHLVASSWVKRCWR